MKPKTYKFKGKTVIAVPETNRNTCIGCEYKNSGPCWREEMEKAGVPSCADQNIIFKLATDEKQD